MPCEMQSKRNAHSLLTGMENGPVILENSFTVSHKGKHRLTMWLSVTFLGIYLNRYENLGPYETCTCMFVAKPLNTGGGSQDVLQ